MLGSKKLFWVIVFGVGTFIASNPIEAHAAPKPAPVVSPSVQQAIDDLPPVMSLDVVKFGDRRVKRSA